MKTTIYEVWNKPDNGPLTVQERGIKGELSFLTEVEAVDLAALRKRVYPHMDFVVVEDSGGYSSASRVRKLVYDTEIPPAPPMDGTVL